MEVMTSLYAEPESAAAVAPPVLEAVDVLRIFRQGEIESVALRGVSMRIERGEAVAIVGPSGSGKSTLLQLAAGLDVPSAGEIRVLGTPLTRMDERELASYRARLAAIVFQRANLWPFLSAEDNVRTSLRLAGRDSGREAARAALAEVGLRDRARNLPSQLSGGEQQRVAIAAAAAREPALVLADEPTGELDAANEQLVLQALLDLRSRGAAVVIVTHSAHVASAVDRVIHIRDGVLEDEDGNGN